MGGEPGRHQLRSKTGSDLQPRLLHRFSCRLLLQTGECLLYNAQKTEFKNIKMPLCGEGAKWVGVSDAVLRGWKGSRSASITVKNRFRPGAVATAPILSPFVATDRDTSLLDGTENGIQKY